MKKPKPLRLHPVERAVLRQQWSADGIQTQLHALLNDDVAAIADRAGSLFFVALWAASTDGLPADNVDRRVIRGAVMQLADLNDKPTINDLQRNAVRAGLEAVGRMTKGVSAEALALACHHLFHIARARPVTLRDFPQADFPAAFTTAA